MPSIRDAVLKGPLNETERKIFEVLTTHPDYIFSTSVEDLAELAAWCVYPASDQPPEIFKTPGKTLSINDKISVYAPDNSRRDEAHCTLRTISVALASLAKTNRIWSGKLYFGEDPGEAQEAHGRTYYGEKQAHLRLVDVLEELNGESRAIGWFTTTSSDDTPEELGPEESGGETDTVLDTVLAKFPPRIVALSSHLASPTGRGGYTLRVPLDGRGFTNVTYDAHTAELLPEPSRWKGLGLYEMLPYGRIRSPIIELGNRLVDFGGGSRHVGPGYYNASWDATFFGVPGTVAQSIKTWLDNHGVNLVSTEQLLGLINLLAKRPVPPFCDFTTVGIHAEALMAQLQTAKNLGTISYGSRDQGPAFTVHDEESYQRLVLAPAFKKTVEELLSYED